MSFSQSPDTMARLKRWFPWLAAVGIAILIAGSWQKLQTFRWDAFLQVYAQIHWGWMALAAALVLGTYLARVLRWQMMIRPLAPDAGAWNLFKATAIGFSAVILLGRPGEFVRPWLIARREKVPFSSQMATWFLERVFDLLAVLVLFGIGLYAFDPSGRNISPEIASLLNIGGALVAVLASACLVILFFAGRSKEELAERLVGAAGFLPEHAQARIRDLAASFTSGMACCRKSTDLLSLLSVTALEWVVICGGTICFFRAFPLTSHMSNLDTVVYIGFVSLGSIVQIPGIGGGVQIAGTVVLSQLFGLETERATGIAVANWLVTWVSILPIGTVLAAKEGLQWQSLRRIGQQLQEHEPQS